jgi:hypothetical protein
MPKFLVNDVPNPFWRHVTEEFFSPGGTSSGLRSLHFMGAFAQLRIAPSISFRPVCLFVRTPACIRLVPTGLILISFYIETCTKNLWKTPLWIKSDKNIRHFIWRPQYVSYSLQRSEVAKLYNRLPLDESLRNSPFEYFSKIDLENSSLIKIWPE